MGAVAVDLDTREKMLRVFVAEDSHHVVESLTEFLSASGRSRVVAVAASEAEALDWAGAHPRGWDVAVVDLILDQGSGFGLIRRLKRNHPGGRVVVFSGFVTDVIRAHCQGLGADLVLGKDQNAELANYIDEIIASR